MNKKPQLWEVWEVLIMNKKPPTTIIADKNYSFERVDIFLRVMGRLPTEKGDSLTQEILDEYCHKYETNQLKQGIVNLKYMYDLIQDGHIKAYAPKIGDKF